MHKLMPYRTSCTLVNNKKIIITLSLKSKGLQYICKLAYARPKIRTDNSPLLNLQSTVYSLVHTILRIVTYGWWSGVVVSTLTLINEVNLRRTRLVLRWVTVSGSIPGAGHLFQYVTNQPPTASSAFHPSGVGK